MGNNQPTNSESTLLGSFEQNFNSLVSKFKSKKVKQGKESTKTQAQPQKDWTLDDWIKWAKDNVDQENQYPFRLQLEKMFQHDPQSQFTYKEYDLNEETMEDLDSFSNVASRYNHSENVSMCFIHSIYTSMAKEKGIHRRDVDQTLWKIGHWKDNNTKTNIKMTANNFKVAHSGEVQIPILTSKEKDLNPKKKNLLFPNEPLNDNQKKAQFLELDNLCHHTELLLNNKISQDQLSDTFRKYSNEDYMNFIVKVAQAKAQYLGKYVYRPPTSGSDGMLPEFDDNEKVAIVGDWGTRLQDSFDLIDELVLRREATIVIHLGDVYYAGFPQQFLGISNKINQLRQRVPSLRYYTIPGNHDYYTNGGPFFEHLGNCNEGRFQQKFSFFCLRNRRKTLQFVGLDTGRNQCGLTDQINPTYAGTYVEPTELQWGISKIKQFNGQTILLTHHQVFSVCAAINGRLTKFGAYNQQINSVLAEQLVDVVGNVSMWMWGHQHKMMCFVDNAYGIPKARLMGNSAFQINKEYDMKFGSPNIVIPDFTPEMTKGWIDHTGALVTQRRPNQIKVEYVNMTSSYDEYSHVTRSIEEQINTPLNQKKPVFTNKPYQIIDASCLPWNVYKDYVWLNFAPTKFRFTLANDPNCIAPITQDNDVIISTEDGKYRKYLYLSFWNYLQVSSNQSDASVFRITSNNGNPNIIEGKTIGIHCPSKGVDVGRYFYLDYYRVAAGGSTEVKPIRIVPPYS